MTLKIVVAGITMDMQTPDANGCVWGITEFDGWESPVMRTNLPDYASRDGVAQGLSTYGARALNLVGVCKCPNEAAFWASYNSILGLTGDMNQTFDVTVSEDVDKTVSCIKGQGAQGGYPQITIGPGYFNFTLPILAPDPLKRGANVTTTIAGGASGTLTNSGNYSSPYVTATLTSDGTLKLTCNGLTISSGTTVMTSGTVLDFNERNVMFGTKDRYSQLDPRSNWFALVKGANTVQNSGTASVQFDYRPAWI